MLPDKIDMIPPDILFGILRLLKLDTGVFMQRLLSDSPTEVLIYAQILIIYTRSQKVCY